MPLRTCLTVTLIASLVCLLAIGACAEGSQATLNWESQLTGVSSRSLGVDESDGSVYVHDGSDGVLKYSADGKLLMKIGPELKDASGAVVGKIGANSPTGMAIDPLTRYLHVSSGALVQIIDATGDTPVYKGKYKVSHPSQLSFSVDGKRLYVAGGGAVPGSAEMVRKDNGTPADYTDDTFEDSGLVLSETGALPPATGYKDPRGCTVDPDGRVFVCDLGGGARQIRRYSAGKLDLEFYTRGTSNFCISTDSQGRLWAVDLGIKENPKVRCYASGFETFSFDPLSNGTKMVTPEMVACDRKRDRVIVLGKAANGGSLQSWTVSPPAIAVGKLSGRIVDSVTHAPAGTNVSVVARSVDSDVPSDPVACYPHAPDYALDLPVGTYRLTAMGSGYLKNGAASIEANVAPGAQTTAADLVVVSLESKRLRDRAAYKPVQLSATSSPRQTVDLTGDWLFKPSQEMPELTAGSNPKAEDQSWHVLGVPQFWGIQNWSNSHGSATYNHYFRECERCDRFTFDYAKTSSGWYRTWVQVPDSMRGKRFVLKFNGVAMISQVYWNGKPVGGHVGMYGPFECEVTDQVRYGQPNLCAVFVSRGRNDTKAQNDLAAVAVTVRVTQDMISSLPDGHFFGVTGGIWQAVKLEVTNRDRIADVFFNPSLTGATIQTTVDRKSIPGLSKGARLEVKNTLTDVASLATLYSGLQSTKTEEKIAGLKPKLWSPEHPNLYLLKTQLMAGGKVVDEVTNRVGFRTFEVKGPKLYLNGRPYYLRGANSPGIGFAPSDKAVADKTMQLMHDGNEMITRFHGTPVGHIWLDAADRYGVGVSMEGQWSWVLINQNAIPSRDLMDAWNHEYLEIVRANRNHPSVLMWTLGNENYFHADHDPDTARKTEKYRLFSDLAKAVRKTMPGLPIVFYSGYSRTKDDYEKIIKPNNFDDGDMDDWHEYFGWYQTSVLQLDIKNLESAFWDTNRPLISQEHGLPYSDSDTGHVLTNYQVKATAWVGDKAYHTASPEYFLKIQALNCKETAEKIRREGARNRGWLYFCAYSWLKNNWDAGTMQGKPVYWEMKKALQPVLVTLMSNSRHFMAGEKFTSEVVLVNDDPDRASLKDLTLEWRVHGQSLTDSTSGIVAFPDCPYDSKARKSVEFDVPFSLPLGRSEMQLELVVTQRNEVVSRNTYDIICSTRDWVSVDKSVPELVVLEKNTATSAYLAALGARCRPVSSVDWRSLDRSSSVVIGDGFAGTDIGSTEDFAAFVRDGGKVLMLQPRLPSKDANASDSILGAIPGFPADQVNFDAVAGEFVDVQSPILADGLDPMDMRWLNAAPGDAARCCSISYRFPDGLPGVTKLARYVSPHGYVNDAEVQKCISWPAFEVQIGKGRVLVSSIRLAEDPVAKRFLRNAIQHLAK